MRHLSLVVDNSYKRMCYEVFINNESYGTYTPDAYKELLLQMSTDDYAMHIPVRVYVDETDEFYTLEDVIGAIV